MRRPGSCGIRLRRHLFGPGFDGERAAAGHGVAGVDDQIQEHLVEHPGVGRVIRRARMKIELQATSSPMMRWSILVRLVDDFIQIELARLHDLTTAEGEQLAGEAGRALRRRPRSAGAAPIAAFRPLTSRRAASRWP